MKLLLDACVWGGAKSYLKTKGHDVLWAGDWSEDPGDREILEKAHKEGRVLVTLDNPVRLMTNSPETFLLSCPLC